MLKYHKGNIVLIVLDTLRYDFWIKILAGSIFRWVKDLVVFHNAFSSATWTPPAHASIFTGKYPHQHGVLAKGDTVSPLKEKLSLAYRLRQLGYYTYALTSNPIATPFIGRGFLKVVEIDVGKRRFLHEIIPIKRLRSYYDPPKKVLKFVRKLVRNSYYFIKDLIMLGEKYYGSIVVNQAVIDLLKRGLLREPFFLFINYMDAHDYLSCTDILSRWRAKAVQRKDILARYYENAVKRLAKALNELLELFQEQGFLERTMIIITSDHGELLDEYGLMNHGHAYPYNELIHVPLMIYDPIEQGCKELTKIYSIKNLHDLILDKAMNGKTVIEHVDKSPEYVVVEDRTLWPQPKHYRCVIKPPVKVVLDLVNNKYNIQMMNLRGYNKNCIEEDLREAIKILYKIDMESRIYEKLRNIRRKLSI